MPAIVNSKFVFPRVTGVMADGAPVNALLVPVDARTRLELPVGVTADLPILVLRPSGAPVPLDGLTLTLSVRKRPQDGLAFPAVVAQIQTPSAPGQATLTINGLQTQNLNPGTYLYDIWIQDLNGNTQPVIPASPLVFTPSIF